MIAAYLDSSVVLRVVLEQPEPLHEWASLDHGIASELLRVECLRGIERLWRQGALNDADAESKRRDVAELLQNVQLVPVETLILARAAEPFPTYVATLDAIHLATAMLYRAAQARDERPILFATHDLQLAKAARAMHFDVIGAAS